MHNVQGVHVRQSFQQLVHQKPDQLGLQPVRRFLKHFQQVVLHVLEDQVDDALFAEGLLQLHYRRVFQHFQYFYFPHGCFFDDFIFLGLLKLLDGHDFFVLVAPAFEHHSVCAFPDQA